MMRQEKILLALLAALALTILAAAIFLEPVYGECRDTIEGRVCQLIGYR